jgi:hypothetical protein
VARPSPVSGRPGTGRAQVVLALFSLMALLLTVLAEVPARAGSSGIKPCATARPTFSYSTRAAAASVTVSRLRQYCDLNTSPMEVQLTLRRCGWDHCLATKKTIVCPASRTVCGLAIRIGHRRIEQANYEVDYGYGFDIPIGGSGSIQRKCRSLLVNAHCT